MDTKSLINLITQQVAVLLAHLSSDPDDRTSLSDISDTILLKLAEQLQEKGLSRKIAADMFGMTPRAYVRKLNRLQKEADSLDEISIWSQVYKKLRKAGEVQRERLLTMFPPQREDIVRSVLHDMVQTGVADQIQSRNQLFFRLNNSPATGEFNRNMQKRLHWNILLFIYRNSPISYPTLFETMESFDISEEEVIDMVNALLSAEVVTEREGEDGEVMLVAEHCIMDIDEEYGFAISLYDHINAVVSAVCVKLRLIRNEQPHNLVGGSTYSFNLHPDHPFETELTSLLDTHRYELNALIDRVSEYNDAHPEVMDHPEHYRLYFYFGQNIVGLYDNEPELVEE